MNLTTFLGRIGKTLIEFDLMKLQMEEMKNDVCRTMSEWTESLDHNAENDTEEEEKPQGEEVKTKEQMKQCRTVVGREGLAPHHSEDLGLVGEGAPVRPRVAGGGGGDEREGQELPGHHEDSFMEESSDDDVDIINERGEIINYEEADSDDSEDKFKNWMMLEVQLKECWLRIIWKSFS